MLCDNSSDKLAERGIIKAISNTDGVSKSFTQPTLLFDAPAYHFMIDLLQTLL